MSKILKLHIIFFITLIVNISDLQAQNAIKLIGYVTDSVTADPISYVSVYIKGTTIGAMTNDNGKFEFNTEKRGDLTVSCIGYEEYSVNINSLKDLHNIRIKLKPTQIQLQEVLIKPKKEKYSKKNNPAVEFVENVIANKQKNDPKQKDYLSYEGYEKLS